MPIPYQQWKIVNTEVLKVKDCIDRLEQPPTVTPDECLRVAHQSLDIISTVREQCEQLGSLVNHDALTDLNAIITFLTLGIAQNRSIEVIVESVRKHAWALIRTVDALKFWVESAELQIESVKLDHFFQNILPRLTYEFNGIKGRSVRLNIEHDLKVIVHEPTLATLLINMCSNSSKRAKGADILEIKVYSCGHQVKIDFSDNGCGIDDKCAEHIFEYGFSGSNGSGLGLAGGDERMWMMDGSIACEGHGGLENNVGIRGAKFTLTLQKSL